MKFFGNTRPLGAGVISEARCPGHFRFRKMQRIPHFCKKKIARALLDFFNAPMHFCVKTRRIRVIKSRFFVVPALV